MKITETDFVTDFQISNKVALDSNSDRSLELIADEPVIERDLDLTVDDEILVIPEVAEIEFLLVPVEPIDETPPSLADLYPLQTTIEDSQLVHTPVFPEVGVDSLMADEPVIERDLDLTVDDEILVIPEVAEIEFLLVPIEPIDETPPSLADLYPLQTTIEDNQLVHTPVFPEASIDLVDANYG